MDFYDVGKGSLKKRSGWIDKIRIHIKQYKQGLDSGIFKDLSEEELNYEVFDNIKYIEVTISEYLDRYLDINPTGISKINKKNMKIMLTKITQD